MPNTRGALVVVVLGEWRRRAILRGLHGSTTVRSMASRRRTKSKNKEEKKGKGFDLDLDFDFDHGEESKISIPSKAQAFLFRLWTLLLSHPQQAIPFKPNLDFDFDFDHLDLDPDFDLNLGLIRRFPALFELYSGPGGGLWCAATPRARELAREEMRARAACESEAVRRVRKLLMMSPARKILLEKFCHLRSNLGLPPDFNREWPNKYPALFKLSGPCLELLEWDPSLAISALERKKSPADAPSRLRFPLSFDEDRRLLRPTRERIESFQAAPYTSPYADRTRLRFPPRSFGEEKLRVAVIHEILSLTVEKKLVLESLGQFRKDFGLPKGLLELLLKHDGIFSVTKWGFKTIVVLKEAYRGSELIEESPMVVWKRKFIEAATGPRKSAEGVRTGVGDTGSSSDWETCASDIETDNV